MTKPGPFDIDTIVALSRRFSDLAADMLAFAIAVCPDDQGPAISRLFFNILGDQQLVL